MSMPTEKSLQNLIPVTERDPERAREIRVMGAKAKAEKHRRNETLREAFKAVQGIDVPLKGGGVKSASDAIALAVVQKAVKGDLKAIELLWDALYGKQTKVDVTSSDGSMSPRIDFGKRTLDEVMEMVDRMPEDGPDGQAGA